MQLLYFLLILFQDFLHNLLSHKPILHFRFGLAVLCIGAFLSFQKHRILCVQLADARELFVRTVLFLIQRIIPKMQKAPSLKTERLASRE